MTITSISAKELAKLGVNLTITAEAGFTSISVKDIAKIMKSKNSHLTLHGSPYTSITLKDIATILGNNLTLVL